MSNTFKQHMAETYSHNELPQYVLDHMDDADQFQSAVVYFAAEWVANELTQGEYQEQALEA